MKVVILAGGFGTRLSDYTHSIPKPMVEIAGTPILIHIMSHFSKYNFNDFIIATGYKSEIIKDYFLNNSSFKTSNSDSDFIVVRDFKNEQQKNWSVSLVNTGLNTMTGGRIKRIKSFLNNEDFMMTYGDGISNINLKELELFHRSHGKIATVTSVHPPARFGEMTINNKNEVKSFKEKPQTTSSWINGGYFVFQNRFINYIENDDTVLEKSPLENCTADSELMAYKHNDFWQCMDTKRDKDYLDNIYKNNNNKWPDLKI